MAQDVDLHWVHLSRFFSRDGVVDAIPLHQPVHIQFDGVGAMIADRQEAVVVGDDVVKCGGFIQRCNPYLGRSTWATLFFRGH